MDLLLRGKPDEQAHARTEIGLILEARGDDAAAEDVYWANVQTRASDPRAYQRLLVLYQKRGDRLSETLVLRQMETVFGEADGGVDPSSPTPLSSTPPSTGPSASRDPRAGRGEPTGHASPFT